MHSYPECPEPTPLSSPSFGRNLLHCRYKVVSKLGSGAFADVLRVKDLRGGRDCAVKVLRPAAAHPAGLQPEVALFREARALKHAKHP